MDKTGANKGGGGQPSRDGPSWCTWAMLGVRIFQMLWPFGVRRMKAVGEPRVQPWFCFCRRLMSWHVCLPILVGHQCFQRSKWGTFSQQTLIKSLLFLWRTLLAHLQWWGSSGGVRIPLRALFFLIILLPAGVWQLRVNNDFRFHLVTAQGRTQAAVYFL